MCGLIGLISKKGRPVGQQVFQLYNNQSSRGKEGFGYIAIDSNWKMKHVIRSRFENGIREALNKEKAEIILFHHRMPTSTKNTIGTTHPIKVVNKELKHDYYVAHNGVISNKDSMKSKHERMGYQYVTEFTEKTIAEYANGETEELSGTTSSFNDSESLAIDIARHLDGLDDEIHAMGAAAFWAIKLKKGTNQVLSIFYGKNQGRELKTTRNKKYFGFASSTGQEIEDMKIFSYDAGDPQLYEQELPMSRWTAPVKRTVGYGAQQQLPAPRFDPSEPSTNDMFSGMIAYDKLENKHYLYSEALDTGIPLSEFMAFRTYGYTTYVPQKFANKEDGRKPPLSFLGEQVEGADEDVEVVIPVNYQRDIPEKERRLLEDYCIEYVQLETKSDEVTESYEKGVMEESTFIKKIHDIESRQREIEELSSALGIPEEIVEEVMDLTREMESYNQAYSQGNYLQTS